MKNKISGTIKYIYIHLLKRKGNTYCLIDPKSLFIYPNEEFEYIQAKRFIREYGLKDEK